MLRIDKMPKAIGKKFYNILKFIAFGEDSDPRISPRELAYWLLRGRIDLIYRAYFNTVFDWKKIDLSVIKNLENLPVSGEGSLFSNPKCLTCRTQANFLASIFEKVRPKKIIEVGTHSAMFCYFAHLCDSSITIDTFGNEPASKMAVDMLNNKFGSYISFYLGDSGITLSKFSPDYQIDFAWIDGGHYPDTCLFDLINCARLKIPSIAVDDYRSMNEVKMAVDEFMEKFDYSIAQISNLADNNGIINLVKKT